MRRRLIARQLLRKQSLWAVSNREARRSSDGTLTFGWG